MVATRNLVEGRAPERREQRADLIGCAKRIPAPLHEQYRLANRREVRVAPLLGPAWRMERVAEEHDAADRARSTF
jgi:hypothetical protein